MDFYLPSVSRHHRPIAGALLILLVAFLATGCSLFGSKSQSVTISTNVPEAKVYVDGELLGEGQTSYPYEIPRRMKTITVTAQADGYADGYKRTSKSLSTLGILDIIGGVCLLVPFIGLVADGAYEQGPSDVSVYLTPLKAGETAVASAAADTMRDYLVEDLGWPQRNMKVLLDEEESNSTYGVTLQPVIMTDTSNKDIWNLSLK